MLLLTFFPVLYSIIEQSFDPPTLRLAALRC